jgi:Ohr subfamily peroxiredoxin
MDRQTCLGEPPAQPDTPGRPETNTRERNNVPITFDQAMYVGTVTALSGRDGQVKSDDGKLDLRVSQPVEVGGSGVGTNPEQLFAATYAACFHASIAIIARLDKVDITGSKVTAKVGFGKNDEGFGIVARLVADLPGVDPEAARRLVEKAHQICPYSRMTREGINVEIDILDAVGS